MATVMVWKPSLSVGVAEIDAQHQELFSRVNNLLEATSHGQGKDEVGKLLDFLASYVSEHFATEERYMEAWRFPDAPGHKLLHQRFRQTVQGLKAHLESQSVTSLFVILVQKEVCDWLLQHVAKADMEYARFLRQRVPDAGSQSGRQFSRA